MTKLFRGLGTIGLAVTAAEMLAPRTVDRLLGTGRSRTLLRMLGVGAGGRQGLMLGSALRGGRPAGLAATAALFAGSRLLRRLRGAR
jgi:hypothetical protein